ncbi:ADP-ribosylglycohydrolase family protein [Vagococcus entomophilus]|uniref:ADP-ribosylglycohydrolase n=1 Tax=Vagococcus entomophilus TaxID=1160095 RepID=A0A430AFB5_9ENTE|nr:ADP-ribosylglycohydrolase family protein [Vagococcus entomophilus]RSU06411.1 ADP-ribosylglycohydrolase [Vagococcus entomophilus]
MTSKEERVRGVLIGGALGDAMGMPTELWTQAMIQEEFPRGVQKLVSSINKGAIMRDMKAGQITDDTINVLFILEMICEAKGQLSVETYLEKLMDWTQNSPIADLVSGPSTRRALEQMKQGISIYETGRFGTTNGASMKIAPIGLIRDYKRMDELVETVHQICIPTHNTGIAIAGASAVAASISYAISGGQSLEDLWSLAEKSIRMGLKKGYDVPTASLVKRLVRAKEIAQEPDTAIKRLYEELGTGTETIETIPAVFAVITLAEGNPNKAVKLAASLGGDTDTIGAIAGGICGALHPDFSQEDVVLLETVNQLDFHQLTKKIMPYVI